MLRFGSALNRASQHFGKTGQANAGFRELIKQQPDQRLSSQNCMNMVNALIPGRLGQKSLERRNLEIGRS